MCSGASAAAFANMAVQSLQAFVQKQRQEADLAQQRANLANQAKYEEYQAKLKENQVLQNEYDTRRELRTLQRKYAQQDGSRLSLMGASGVETNTGSALDVLLDSTSNQTEDLFGIRNQAKREQQALAYEASLLRTRAANTKKQSRDRRTFLEKGLEYYQLANQMSPSMNTFFSSYGE